MPKSQQKSNLTYHDNIEQGSAEWLKLREYQFTGSNAYKLLTSFGAGTWAMSKNETWSGNYHTQRGHLLEGEAIDLYERINGVTVAHTGFVTNKKYPNCLYSPDGFLPDRTIEVKCFSLKKHLETIKRPSTNILAQCHFGQLLMERPKTDLILYCPKPNDWDNEAQGEWPLTPEEMLVIKTIKRDKDIHDNFKSIIRGYNEDRWGK